MEIFPRWFNLYIWITLLTNLPSKPCLGASSYERFPKKVSGETKMLGGYLFERTTLGVLLAPRVSVHGRMAVVLLIAVGSAFSWLLWRAYSVIQTSNDLLVEKLGLDIPPSPFVTLEGIDSREIQISWKCAEAVASVPEHHIEVNGKHVGITKKHENAAQIYNLRPCSLYNIRVFSVSAGRFQTPSAVLHVRTLGSSDGQCQENRGDEAPAVRALAPRLPPTPSIAPAPAMPREQNGGPVGRRGTLGRRTSPAGQEVAPADGTKKVDDETDGNLPELSQQLQTIEREIQSLDASVVEDEKDHENAIKDKEAERDEKRQKLKERDEASSELRKQVHKAEATMRAAGNERSKKERLLEQKKSQRQRRKDDMARWDDQLGIMFDDMENIKSQQAIVERKKQSEISEVRQKISEEETLLKTLEAENREKNQEIKALEEERKQLNAEEETDETRDAERQQEEKDRSWREQMALLHSQQQRLVYELNVAFQNQMIWQQRLDESKRAANYLPVAAVPMILPEIDNFRRGVGNSRPNRHSSSHGSNVSSPRTVFGAAAEPYSMNAHFNTTMNTSPNAVGPAFFNAANGMTLMMTQDPQDDMTEEPEFLTGAPMSPRADALLPADLLGDDPSDDFEPEEDTESPKRSMSGGAPVDAITKIDSESKSPESASTPRSNISPGDEAGGDGDVSPHSPFEQRQQVDEESQDRASPYSKKPNAMASFFQFNRQRGRTLADQPPLLGSLKPGQSQSFPRNFDVFGSNAQPRRRMSYGNNRNPASKYPLGRDQNTQEPERISATRRAFPNIFSKSSAASQNYDPFAPNSIRNDASPSRPSSVYSFDKLPRVSAEGQFHAWAALDKGLSGRNYSPLADWSMSRSQSRRPSIGYGSTSNLSLGPGPEDEYIQPRREPSRPLQAPIGTRPTSSSTPKLNPAAPSFTMLFGKKAKEKAKAKEEERRKASETENISPPESRKSRDAHSIAATTSTYESRESLERSISAFSGSGTPQAETPAKPTFISKITRKASSNKFGSWKGQGGIFSRKDNITPTGTPTGPDTEDEAHNNSFEHLGKSYESMSSTPGEDKDKRVSRSSLSSWNFMRKKPKGEKDKKDDLNAGEVSESAGSERASRASVDVMTEEEDAASEIPLH